MRPLRIMMLASGLALAACGGDDTADAPAEPAESSASAAGDTAGANLSTVSPQEIADVIADPPEGLVVLDVRTPEEFADARIDGATMIDFYDTDFREQLAGLDRDTPYVLYCRSGNRSGQALQMMEELGFTSVQEAGGGIVAWQAAGLPTIGG